MVSWIMAGQGRLAEGTVFSLRSFPILCHININYPKHNHRGCCWNKMSPLQPSSMGHDLCDIDNSVEAYSSFFSRYIKPAWRGLFYVNDISN